VFVPCAYSTIGRRPEQVGATPVGTIIAPDDSVASLAAPMVQNLT
jgi:hypothetical protein